MPREEVKWERIFDWDWENIIATIAGIGIVAISLGVIVIGLYALFE